MIIPINGLEMANQSGIASRKESKVRLRIGECAIAVGNNAARPAAEAFEVPRVTSRELIVFMLSSYR
jgi:hypothetical protein